MPNSITGCLKFCTPPVLFSARKEEQITRRNSWNRRGVAGEVMEAGCVSVGNFICSGASGCERPIRLQCHRLPVLSVACGSGCVTVLLLSPHIIQNSVLCLRFSRQNMFKNQDGTLAFFWFPSSVLLPLRCLRITEHLANICQKWRSGVVPGALGGDLGTTLAPRRPKAQKTSKK